MATALYDLSVGAYIQILQCPFGFLQRGLEHCQKNAIDLIDIVDNALHEDMQNFYFQLMSLNHHSTKTINAAAGKTIVFKLGADDQIKADSVGP